MMSPSPARAAPTEHTASASSSPPNTFFLKITAKKDSTETMVKSLISRTHVPKPESYTLKQNDKSTECFLKYMSMEVVQEVLSKISAEKINGAAFDTEALEVEPQPGEESDDSSPPKEISGESTNDSAGGQNLSKDAIRSITEMLKQNQIPKRKQITLNISPRSKQKRHQRMKMGSKHKRKTKKHSTSSESDTSHDAGIDKNLLLKVKSILSQEPIAAGSMTSTKSKPFDPYSGIPSKPSKVLKDKTRNLLKTIQISSSDEDKRQDPDNIKALLNMVLKNQKMQKKKKKKRYSSSDSSDSSDDSSTSSSSSSSDASPTKIRRKLKKLQKKGKLKSGRHRKGLAVIRNEIWPHDGVNARLAGKTFPNVESLTIPAFVAGILNPILDSEEFRKLEKKKFAPKMRQKLKILNELAHGIIRSQNFPEVRDFYLSTLEEIETGQGSWKDEEYWMTQMVLFRTVLRSLPTPSRQLGGNRRNLDPIIPGPQPRDCCYQFNNDGCSKESPHPNNDPTRSPELVHHFCKICLRKNLKKVHAAKACKGGTAGQ